MHLKRQNSQLIIIVQLSRIKIILAAGQPTKNQSVQINVDLSILVSKEINYQFSL